MSIDLDTEELLTFAEASRILPKRPAPCTFWRWRTIGVNGAKLECIRSGNRWLTSRRALQRFLSAQTASSTPTSPDPTTKADIESKLRAARLMS